MLWDGTYGFLSLSKNTRKSNHYVDAIMKVALSPQLFNPLSPNINIQILQTDLYTFP